MKPVELEIFLQDGVSPGLKKAGQTLSRFSGEAKAELREVSESLKLQKSHVSGMEKEYARLEKALKVAAPGKEWMEARRGLRHTRPNSTARKPHCRSSRNISANEMPRPGG